MEKTKAPPAPEDRLLAGPTPLYVASAFVSAFLLFSIQPMIAKMGVPIFGGSPAVWTTCLVFFQVLLLGGYGYAHASTRLSKRAQLAVHLAVLVLPIGVLAPSIPAWATHEATRAPVLALVIALAASVGLPFFALSTNGTLGQRWFLLHTGREPYFLYAASNAGSFLALLAYPFAIEPFVDLRTQARLFAGGYLVFVALAASGLVLAMRSQRVVAPAPSVPAPDAPAAKAAGSPLGWALRAMLPSVLLVAVSLRMATDVGSVPLTWVIPLALYLLTFILAFTPSLQRIPRWALVVPTAVLTVALVAYQRQFSEGGILLTAGPLGVLFLGSWVCHADLAHSRPAPAHLTSFYFWISAGGAIGSALTNLVAPLVFSSLAEYPLALTMLAVVLVAPHGLERPALRAALRSPAFWGGVGLLAAVGFLWWSASSVASDDQAVSSSAKVLYRFGPHAPAVFLGFALLIGAVRKRRLSVELPLALAFVAALEPKLARRQGEVKLVHAERSFFGTLQVVEMGSWRSLVHGTTAHGGERLADPSAAEEPPVAYYYPGSPMAWAVTHAPDGPLAVVGLGTGSLARMINERQVLTFYELDPMIEAMARRYFTYLPRAKGEVRVEIGDARIRLQDTDARYHAIIVDAFSSDSIPVHLITEEAIRLYLSRLLPDGVVYVHVSNRYLDLLPVVRSHVAELGIFGFLRRDRPSARAESIGARGSDVVALTASSVARDRLGADGWTALDTARKAVRWTDGRSSLLPILRRRPIH